MQIPSFWAEARIEGKVGGRKRVMRRFGWSDESAAAAEVHARERAEAALAELRAGADIAGRERKFAYGDEGMPIREEVLARRDTEVITRNTYGARCLNEPDVLFADIDLDFAPGRWFVLTAFAEAALLAVALLAFVDSNCLRALAVMGCVIVWGARVMQKQLQNERNRARFLERVNDRVRECSRRTPGALFALYETPNGVRVLALHRTFQPRSDEVARLFSDLGADPAYARLCRLQACFRTRVSPKPWRIGLSAMAPRGVWPVAEQDRTRREAWVADYEAAARGYAACRFAEEIGEGLPHPRCLEVQRIHDELSKAREDLPIA